MLLSCFPPLTSPRASPLFYLFMFCLTFSKKKEHIHTKAQYKIQNTQYKNNNKQEQRPIK